jgi:hypothetical protein
MKQEKEKCNYNTVQTFEFRVTRLEFDLDDKALAESTSKLN